MIPIRSVAVVMSADLIIIGDHVGRSSFMSAPTPAMCGLDIDVPWMLSKSRPLKPAGETAARMSTPGAEMSGLRMSLLVAGLGPREENPAISGAGTDRSVVKFAIDAVAPASTSALRASNAATVVNGMCTAGTEWMIANSVLALVGVLASTMPIPPASLTARLLFTSTFPPRSQNTIFPVTSAGSSTGTPPLSAAAWHCAAWTAVVPVRPESAASTSAPVCAGEYERPSYLTPSTVTEPRPVRLCVLAATVVSHGPGAATVPAPGPAFPAEAATNTPDAAALKNATITGSRKLV